MFDVDTVFENGWPALVVMVGCVLVLVFLRFGVPYLIERFQRKRP